MIANPAYKGPWAAAKIANPKFFEDKTPLKSIGRVGAVALEIWTMSKGLVVDNVLVSADEVAAGEMETGAWKPKYNAVKKAAAAEEAVKAKEAAEETAKDAKKDGDAEHKFATKVTDAMYGAVDALPAFAIAATDYLRLDLRAVVDYLASNTNVLYAVMALAGGVVLMGLLMCLMPGSKDTDEVDEAAVAKKEDKTGADDKAVEGEEDEGSESDGEEEKPAAKTPSKGRKGPKRG
jgi:hypothetical protein